MNIFYGPISNYLSLCVYIGRVDYERSVPNVTRPNTQLQPNPLSSTSATGSSPNYYNTSSELTASNLGTNFINTSEEEPTSSTRKRQPASAASKTSTTLLVPLLSFNHSNLGAQTSTQPVPSTSKAAFAGSTYPGLDPTPGPSHIRLGENHITSNPSGQPRTTSFGVLPINPVAVGTVKPLSSAWQTALSSATSMSTANKRRVQRRGKVIQVNHLEFFLF